MLALVMLPSRACQVSGHCTMCTALLTDSVFAMDIQETDGASNSWAGCKPWWIGRQLCLEPKREHVGTLGLLGTRSKSNKHRGENAAPCTEVKRRRDRHSRRGWGTGSGVTRGAPWQHHGYQDEQPVPTQQVVHGQQGAKCDIEEKEGGAGKSHTKDSRDLLGRPPAAAAAPLAAQQAARQAGRAALLSREGHAQAAFTIALHSHRKTLNRVRRLRHTGQYFLTCAVKREAEGQM